MALILHFLPFRFASQRLDKIQIKCSMDTATLILKPQFFSILLDEFFHQCGLENDFFFSRLRRCQAKLDLAFIEKFFKFPSFYLASYIFFLVVELLNLEIQARNSFEVALF